MRNVFFKSTGDNSYFYSYHRNSIHYLHPVLSSIARQKEDNNETEVTKDSKVSSSSSVWHYNNQKYHYLKNHGFFKEFDESKYTNLRVNKEIVEYLFANTRQVVFEATDKCNLSCEYCAFGKYYQNYDNRSHEVLDYNNAIALVEKLFGYWESNIYASFQNNLTFGFYGGEPLINIELIKKIVKYIRLRERSIKSKIRFKFNMTTNGLLLNKHLDFLVKQDFSIAFSLDGSSKNNEYRKLVNGKPSFQRIISNIDLLKKNYPKFFKNNVTFISVLHNKNSIIETVNFIKNRYKKAPIVIPLSTVGLNPEFKDEFWEKYSNPYESFQEALSKGCQIDKFSVLNSEISHLSKFILSRTNYFQKNFKYALSHGYEKEKYPTGTCLPFSRKIYLSVKGKIFTCERIGHDYSLGSVINGQVHIDFDEIAKKINNYYDRIINLCSKCYQINDCGQCFYLLKRGFHDAELKCDYFRSSPPNDIFTEHLSFLERQPRLFKQIINNVTYI